MRVRAVINTLLNRVGLRKMASEPLADTPPRVMMYCASDVGLGHFSRLNRIATALRARMSDVNILMVTDILPSAPGDFDESFGVLRIPPYLHSKRHSGRASGMTLPHHAIQRMRIGLITEALLHYKPHLWVMDTGGPHGKRNELEEPLRLMRARFPKSYSVMEMRDIPCPPEEYRDPKVAYDRRIRSGHQLYDFFLASGHPNLFDVCKEYNWTGDLARKVTYCGIVTPRGEEAAPAPKAPGQKRVIASFGGGWQAGDLLPGIRDTHRRLREEFGEALDFHLFTGPALAPEAFSELKRATKDDATFHVERFSTAFPGLLASADLALLQAGSTPYQILDTAIPMVLYTRDYTTQEQQVRAKRLAEFPGITAIDAEWLGKNDLAALSISLLKADHAPRETGITFDGIDTAARILHRVLEEKPRGEALFRILGEESPVA